VDTRSAAGFLNDVAEVLASDLLDGKWAMLWNDEQRGMGELMTERPSGESSIVRGHAASYRDYDDNHETFALWMERFPGDPLWTWVGRTSLRGTGSGSPCAVSAVQHPQNLIPPLATTARNVSVQQSLARIVQWPSLSHGRASIVLGQRVEGDRDELSRLCYS
jgi:hypothetical protein